MIAQEREKRLVGRCHYRLVVFTEWHVTVGTAVVELRRVVQLATVSDLMTVKTPFGEQ